MIELIATAESWDQAKALLQLNIDTLIFGEETFGLRLPHSFTRDEQKAITDLCHLANKKASVAVNGIMHPEKMKLIPEYLAFLKSIDVDQIIIGDPGILYVMQQNPELALPFIWDSETLVTSARQINFWAKRGAQGAVLAREVPFGEMQEMIKEVSVPVEVLVYGATCIHQSKRPLLQNYYNYSQQEERKDRARDLFLSEPKKDETHYSIYEDSHGTHIFADNDLNLMNELAELVKTGFTTWKLDGILAPGENYVKVVALFAKAKAAIAAGTWNEDQAQELSAQVAALHPANRGLDTGFYYIDPASIK